MADRDPSLEEECVRLARRLGLPADGPARLDPGILAALRGLATALAATRAMEPPGDAAETVVESPPPGSAPERACAAPDTARAPCQSSLRPSLASAPPRGGFAPSASPSAILAHGGEASPPDPPKDALTSFPACAAPDMHPTVPDSAHGLAEPGPERACAAPDKDPGRGTVWIQRERTSQEAHSLAEEVMTASRDPTNRIGRYIVLSMLGAGGMGVVFRAWDSSLSRVVALKRLLEDPASPSPRLRERFVREGRAAARLRHPGIVAVHDVGECAGRPYMTMDYIEGTTLDARLAETAHLREIGDPKGLGRQRDEIEILARVAEAVGFAHASGIVHRDLKPGNVLLDREGRPFVGDFGLAKDLLRTAGGSPLESLTADGGIVGTPAYMSPEQAMGAPGVGPASDVFGLGVMLYRTLVGRLPFEGDGMASLAKSIATSDPVPPRRVSPRVSRDLETVCLKCMEKDPSRRYSDGSALAADLRRWLAGDPVEARPVSFVRKSGRWARRHPRSVAAAAFSVALAATGAGVWFHQRARAREDLRSLAEIAQLGSEARGAWRAGNTERLHELAALVDERADELLARNPDQGEVHLERGRVRLLAAGGRKAVEELERARDDLDRAAALLGPDDPRPWAERGRVWVALYRRGIEEERLEIKDPDLAVRATPFDLEEREPALSRLREAAERDLAAAARASGGGAEEALLDAYLAYLRGDWARVLARTEEALRHDALAEAHWLRGLALLEREEDARAAVRELQNAVLVGKGFGEAWISWAEARGRVVESVRHELITLFCDGKARMDEIETLREELDGAIAASYRAMELGADTNHVGRVLGELSWTLGEILRKASYKMGAWDIRKILESHLAALSAVRSEFQDVRFLFHLAQLQECYAISHVGLQQRDNRAELARAIETYTDCLDREPGFARAHLWRGNARYAQGLAERDLGGDAGASWRAAIEDYDRYVELAGEKADLYYSALYRGLSRFSLGEWEMQLGGTGLEHFRAALAELEPFGDAEAEAQCPRAICRLEIARALVGGPDAGEDAIRLARKQLELALSEAERAAGRSGEDDRRLGLCLQGRLLVEVARLKDLEGEDPSADARTALERLREGELSSPGWAGVWAACARVLLARQAARSGADPLPLWREAVEGLARGSELRASEVLADFHESLPYLDQLAAFAAETPADPVLGAGALALARVAAGVAASRSSQESQGGAPAISSRSFRDLAFRAIRAASRHGDVDWEALAREDAALAALTCDPRWKEVTGRK